MADTHTRATQPADASALQTPGALLLRGAMRTRRGEVGVTVTIPRPFLAMVTDTFLAPKAQRLQPLGVRAENAGEETDAREWPAPGTRATQPADAPALQTAGAPLLRGAMRTRRAFIS